jgi:hypothetical protein
LSGQRGDEDNGQNRDDHRKTIVDGKMAHDWGAFVTEAISDSTSLPVKRLLRTTCDHTVSAAAALNQADRRASQRPTSCCRCSG